nr:hypothetical protein [Tanacetum cinerariifolium]
MLYDTKKIVWVKWAKVLAAKKFGGLGVSSFYALNRALLSKWVWRFISCDNSIWFRFVKAMHGNGLSTRFWSDIWLGDTQLRAKFPRIYALDLYKDCTVADKVAHSLEFNLRHRWRWDLNGSGEFHVKDVRNLLDDLFLPKDDSVTRWSKYVPIKINVFAWRVALDRLPTRTNLLQRGVSVEDLLCPTCHSTQEDLSHVLFSCEVAAAVIRLVCRWWNVDRDYFSSYLDWVSWFKDIRMPSKIKSVLEGVFFSTRPDCFENFLGQSDKTRKTCIENQHVFIPFAFDTFGFLAPEALELLSRIQQVMHSNIMTPRSTDVAFKRIGFAIQNG